MKAKVAKILLSSVALLLGDGVYAQAAPAAPAPPTAPAPPAAPSNPLEPSNPMEPVAPEPVGSATGGLPKPNEPKDVDEKLIVADDGVDKDDPTHTMNEVYDEDDPAWYKAN